METSRTSPGFAAMENSPDGLVEVPRAAPLIVTDAPLSGLPLASEILPLTVVWASKPDEMKSSVRRKKKPFALR